MSDEGAQPDNYEGRTVGNGRYQLRDLLGAGGMASVHLAYDSVLDRQVAVKTLHTELGREAAFRERFRREAQAVAKLTHTNIVSVFDSGEDEIDGNTVPYIVMEYVDGKPLRNVLDEDIAQHGAMPTAKALKITGDVLAALEASHEMGLVHRDIKPGNVMMTRRGVVKVMDFGIARAMQSGVTSMTQTGMVVGTPQYLSPEQALGRGVDARSDLYTVGIMLFELLTGRLPFDADSPLAIAYAHVQEEPVAPSSINQSVPPAVDALVARSLRKNPNERFPTAETMHQECERLGGSGAASGAAPLIISGGPPANSGAGLAQSVFPPVNATGTPPPPSTMPMGQQGSYQGPTPYGNLHGYGPSTPPPANAMQASGYSTPPPYHMVPAAGTQPGGGGGNKNTPLIIGAAVTALVVIIAVGIIIAVRGGDGGGDEPQAGDAPATSAPDTSGNQNSNNNNDDDDDDDDDVIDFKPEDKTKTIDATDCTEARDYFADRDKDEPRKSMPNLSFKNLGSVRECISKAGWKLNSDLDYEDEAIYGKNIVLRQSPKAYQPFDPENDEINLVVSTGKAG
ncbi:Stk1 family PASTA domain-containing Ser/Thr kinase [Streptomyces gobiensis]|uniref:Stk1 family PASTA domain-containing Ser/Thr kinase n=1 Tax=Streptomyces gobiensis TaxID=2875706 RepID=UPI001E2B80AE|nr:Stk1 family PASTA domain-containing Ser/Thr kinase [Streptomyces gobiensis]UGY92653.1 protein kinase [Streptomyces gobiensis]